MNWYIGVLKKYAQFQGRARRQEFWMYTLFNAIVAIVLEVISIAGKFPILYILYVLATLVPSLAVAVRRMHDTAKSGWWILIAIIPIVGTIIFIVLAAQPGTVGPNDHGADPKELVAA